MAIAVASLVGTAGCGLMTGQTGSSGNSGATGSNAASGVLTPSSTSVAFGNVAVGTSTAQLVTLTNTGNKNVKISSVSVTGSGLSESGGANVTLAPRQSVTVSVNFEPTTAGQVTGSLSVSSSASNSVLEIDVTGAGFAQVAQQSVKLSWQPSTSVVIGYYIYRGPATGNLSKLTGTMDTTTSYTDSSVVSGQTYVYAVTAVDSQQIESPKSAPITVTVPSQ